MLPEEMQVEDVLHHQCNAAYASTLSHLFFGIGCPFFWFEHLPPKMSVHVPVFQATRQPYHTNKLSAILFSLLRHICG